MDSFTYYLDHEVNLEQIADLLEKKKFQVIRQIDTNKILVHAPVDSNLIIWILNPLLQEYSDDDFIVTIFREVEFQRVNVILIDYYFPNLSNAISQAKAVMQELGGLIHCEYIQEKVFSVLDIENIENYAK